MAILRVFWGEALHPASSQVYHRNRTISLLGLPGLNVGHDMPIEKKFGHLHERHQRLSREHRE
eukprot:2925167-Pleurochrysis_carterae.AAC.1